MIEKFKRWLHERRSSDDSSAIPYAATSQPKTQSRQFPNAKDIDHPAVPNDALQTSDNETLIRNKFLRKDNGTHETFTILDDALVDSGEETGIDPYNTGSFDRSKTWDRRFRK